jgi:membrane-bound serine protease (ClpP class)
MRVWDSRIFSIGILMIILSGILFVGFAGAEQGDKVYLVDVDDVINEGTVAHIKRAIALAEEDGAEAVILRLDTPGGLVSSTKSIVTDLIFEANVPIITYVGPSSAYAESAGAYILLSGHVAVMTDGTITGSAKPILSGPLGGSSDADDKTIEAMASWIRSIAEERGRSQDVAEDMVRNNLNLNASEALDRGITDLVVEDIYQMLDDLDGVTVRVKKNNVTLNTADASIVEIRPGATAVAYDILSNPGMAFVLFLVGIYGIIFGLAAPGTYVPETMGALLLILGLVGLGMFDFSTMALLLVLLAVMFFIAEVFTPTFGVLTTAGIISLLLGALLLPKEPLMPQAWFREFQMIVVVMTALTAGFFFFIVSFVMKTKRMQPRIRIIQGRRGAVLDKLDPNGEVKVRGELWKARSHNDEPIEVDEDIEVVDREGLTLIVKRYIQIDKHGKEETDEASSDDDAGNDIIPPIPADKNQINDNETEDIEIKEDE